MDTKAGEISGLVNEFSKFARHTAGYLHERAAELEKNMTTVMEESSKDFAMKFGEETKPDSVTEMNPKRAAFVALMSGLMFSRMLKSRGASPFAETAPETKKSGATSKPKRRTKVKAA